jgi:hypothetical protein
LIGLPKTSFLAEELNEDVDEEANNIVHMELVDAADDTNFVGDRRFFFGGVTKIKQDQRKHIIDFD